MIESIVIILIGIIIGLIVGILPGLGTSFILLVFYPIIAKLTADHLLIFYASLTMASQFSGSVSALAYGVFGEVTSMPALRERSTLQKNGLILRAIKNTAHASLFALPIACLIVYALFSSSSAFVYVLRTEIKMILQVGMVIIALWWANNRFTINLQLVCMGLFLGAIGTVTVSGAALFTFGNAYLSSGIPMVALLVGLVAIPGVKQFTDTKLFSNNTPSAPAHYGGNFSQLAAARGSVIGIIMGLIPAIGSTICSNVAWRIEQLFHKSDSVDASMNRVVSAESANNSSAISVMLPLLVFGLPIVPSEIILYSMLTITGWSNSALTLHSLLLIFGAFTISALISWVICGFNVPYMLRAVQKYANKIAIGTTVLACFGVIASGFDSYDTWYYAIILVLASTLGLSMKKIDFTPLVLTFLVAPQLITGASILHQLYF